MIKYLLRKWFDLYTKEDVDWIRHHWFMVGYDCGVNMKSPTHFKVNTDD